MNSTSEHLRSIASILDNECMQYSATFVRRAAELLEELGEGTANKDANYQRPPIRTFDTGATRDTDEGKPDYEGFLSPLVLEAFGDYMTRHRIQSDGSTRDSDNWQKGIPLDAYIKSAWRHLVDWWKEHRGLSSRDGLDEALGGLLFNVMGYWHEHLKEVR